MLNLILAPHVDDEVIGCFSVLCGSVKGDTRVIYTASASDARIAEAFYAAEKLGFQYQFNSFKDVPGVLDQYTGCRIYAPDPHWESHPEHKAVGALAWKFCQDNGWPFISYSTNMNVPYLQELSPEMKNRKASALYQFYPTQRSLWEQDHRYFLFEGLARWNPSV